MRTTPPGVPRVVDCQPCAGSGVVRISLVNDAGKRSRPRTAPCFDCHGRGARIKAAA